MRIRRFTCIPLLLLALTLTGCPDSGNVLDICANPNLSCDDADACTVDRCEPQRGCVNERISCNDGDACTVDTCNPVNGCLNAPISCDDRDECTSDSCDPATGCQNVDSSAECDDGSVCTTDSCDTFEGCVNDPIDCDDGNECTDAMCDAVDGCTNSPLPDGTECDRGLGMCEGGTCVGQACFADSDCNDRDACTMDSCDLGTNECVNTDISADCDDDNACTEDTCDAETGCANTDISDTCDDGDECSVNSCDPTEGCLSEPAPDGTSCDDGAGSCTGGTCVSNTVIEYEQNFETLDIMNVNALADDGWIVFGNVFEAGTGNFLYGYGPFVAPNDGAAFSAIASGQGGPDQGNQQVSIYSDYNNQDHAVGHLIEANVFRERVIVAADVGRTIRFSFDAKAGNINNPDDPLCPCSSVGFGFIKTLDPNAGFSLTNFVREDTTSLPDTWGRLELELRVDAGLVDQLLQIGWATEATLFQPSANFYDNVEVRSSGGQ